MSDKTKRIIPQGPSELPPAGYKRADELAKRTDVLEEKAESLAAAQEVEAIDPDTFEPDDEILMNYDLLHITRRQDDKAYCWIQTGQHGLHVKTKCLMGWEVVQGDDMPEAQELKGLNGDSTRRLGDVVLMRIDLSRKLLLDRQADKRAQNRELSITSTLEEMNDKRAHLGVSAGTMNPEQLAKAEKKAGGRRLAAMAQTAHLRGR